MVKPFFATSRVRMLRVPSFAVLAFSAGGDDAGAGRELSANHGHAWMNGAALVFISFP